MVPRANARHRTRFTPDIGIQSNFVDMEYFLNLQCEVASELEGQRQRRFIPFSLYRVDGLALHANRFSELRL